MRVVALGCFTCAITSRKDITANVTEKLLADLVPFAVSETLGEKKFLPPFDIVKRW